MPDEKKLSFIVESNDEGTEFLSQQTIIELLVSGRTPDEKARKVAR